MPKISNTPKNLKPFIFHGLNVEWSEGGEQAKGDCPFCGREGKFAIAIETGLWRCLVCNEGTENGKMNKGGNSTTFLRLLWKYSDEATKDYSELAKDRRLLYPDTLMHWGVCKSIITGDWLVPGYGADGKLYQLYRYVNPSASNGKSGKRLLLATPDIHHQLFGMPLYNPSKPDVYLCEGPWDGMALWETAGSAKRVENGSLSLTAASSSSLLSTANTLAVPGCNVFNEQWLSLFAGKRVYLMYDNDHPKEHPPSSGKFAPPAGYEGTKRVAHIMGVKAEEPPESIHYLKWGKDGYDVILPSGCDVRDLLTAGAPGEITAQHRVKYLSQMLAKTEPIPEDWIQGRTKTATKSGGTDIDCLPCEDWKVLVNSWRKAMQWTDGLDRALSVMLACVASTRAVGDQLWVKIIGPAASGKSTLCEALSVNKKHIVAKSTMRGFHSGYREKDGSDNKSLILKVRDKTLVTKDGDTLLQAPNKDQILSEARDLYDKTARSDYRSGMGMDHEGVNMTWILCGTSSLRQIDSSELGERFLDCVIMEAIDDDLEDEILWRVANRVERAMSYEANGDASTQYDPDMANAMQLTGGYVHYLRTNARDVLDSVAVPDANLKRCVQLGKFVAYMRARPSKKQDETAEREFAARLVSQITRLAMCLVVVLNKTEVDEEVMRRTRSVALDTARGRTLELVKCMYNVKLSPEDVLPSPEEGADTKSLAHWTNQTEETELSLLRFLRKIGAVENFQKQISTVLKSKPRWRLTPRMVKLYRAVMMDGEQSVV